MYLIKGKKENYGINVPTSLDELTPSVLEKIVEEINIPKNYCIVALACKTKLFSLASSVSSNKDQNLSVVPLLAKINVEHPTNDTPKVGDSLIINRSDLERSTQLYNITNACSAKVRSYLVNDNNLVKDIMTGAYDSATGNGMNKGLVSANSKSIYLLEFKIVPVCDIRAFFKVGIKPNDNFIVSND